MPPFAHGLDSFSGVVQEQPIAIPGFDCEQNSYVELSRSPRFTNFFKINECKEELASPVQMVELIQTAQMLHEMRSQGLQNASIWDRLATKVENLESHDFSQPFESKTSDNIHRATAVRGEEDRKQLGMLLSIPVSTSAHCTTSANCSSEGLVRKRSLTSMIESKDLDQLSLQRSYTSSDTRSESDRKAEVWTKPLKVQKTERLISSGEMIGKDLLSLSQPVSDSSLNSESSSSSRELGPQSSVKKASFPSRSCKNVHSESRSDKLKSTTISSFARQFEELGTEEHIHRPTVDVVTGDTSTHSSTNPSTIDHGVDEPAVRLTLKMEPLTPITRPHETKRAKVQPLVGLDERALHQRSSLLLRNLDTGVEAQGLQLVQLLLKCADATAKSNLELAARILAELYQGASLYGDSMQRVAAYFSEGLAARIVGKESYMYSTLMAQPSTEELFSVFTSLYKVAPYFQFAHFTANQAILEALEGHSDVHVIDLDIMQGFQWPSLIQSLASRSGGPPHLRITGVGKHPNIVRDTGRRLTSFAASFDVPFEFHALVEEKLENLTPGALDPRPGEAIAVNAVLQLHRLINPASGASLHKFLRSLCRKLKPCVFTLVEQEANHNAPSFLGRFMEALHYYAAVFDSLNASLPQQSEERVRIEQLFFAQQIKNIVVCDGDERLERHETFDLWQQRMEMAGFLQVPLSAHAISQAKLLLQFCPFEGYRLHERNGSISLGWQERQLLTASAWSC